MIARIFPIEKVEQSEAPEQLSELLSFVGYRPNALFTMARKPGLLAAVLQMVHVALRGPGLLDPALRFLVSCEACRGSGCFYSTVHMVHAAHHHGISWQKLASLDCYASDDLFLPEERAALRIASAGATLPVGKVEAAFAEAADFYNENELVEIVGAVALFGWFNRWNSLVQSVIEDEPATALAHVPWLRAMSN